MLGSDIHFSMRGPRNYRLVPQGTEQAQTTTRVQYYTNRPTLRAVRAMVLTCALSMTPWIALAIIYLATR